MGLVYRALDLRLKREVAIKKVKRELLEDEVVRARFRREALTLAGISHPNIVAVYDLVDDDEGASCLVLELLHGHSLREATTLKCAPSAPEIAIQMAAALEAAHAQSVLHRDIKPDNIFICNNGLIKLMDFGLASVAASVALTQADAVAGTLAYMSPEQLTDSSLDARSDLYALGVVLYECLSGSLPFAGDNPAAVILHRLNSVPEPVTKLPDEVPAQFQEVVLSLLQPDPAQRIGSATALLKCLNAVNEGRPFEAVTTTTKLTDIVHPQPNRPLLGKQKNVIIPMVTILVLGAAVLAATRFNHPLSERPTAEYRPSGKSGSTGSADSKVAKYAIGGKLTQPATLHAHEKIAGGKSVSAKNTQAQSTAAIVQQLNRQNRQIDILERMLASMQREARSKEVDVNRPANGLMKAALPNSLRQSPAENILANTTLPIRARAYRLKADNSTIYLTAMAPAGAHFAVYQPTAATHAFQLLRWSPQIHPAPDGRVHFEGRLHIHPQAHAHFLVITATYNESRTPPQSIDLRDLRRPRTSAAPGREQSPANRFQTFRRALASKLGVDNLEVRIISLRQLPYRRSGRHYAYRNADETNRAAVPLQP